MIGRDQLLLDRTAGDDCAVLPDPSGQAHLLLAIEGLASDFVQAMPWFAGYSAVMVNLSDIEIGRASCRERVYSSV